MNIINLALTGDNHTNVARRTDEARRIAYWMLEDWKARGVHFIGFGGDIVDGPMTEKDRVWLINYIMDCANVAPVVLIYGNHEIELALECLSPTRDQVYGRPTKYPIVVESGAGVHVVETDAGPIAVACVSFPNKAKLLAAVGSVSAEEADQIAGQALQDVFRGLGRRVEELGLPTVALIHGTVKGSKLGNDQPDRPLGLDIDLADMTLIGADFYCVPHIHKAQHWTVDKAVIATPSSPFYTDFGEAKHEKGYLFAQFDTGIVNATPGDCMTWERIPTPATPMLLIESTFILDDTGVCWSFDPKMLGIHDAQGADVRFRYHYAKEHSDAARNAAEGFAADLMEKDGAFNVTLDPRLIPTTRAGIPGLATTVRIEDKLKLYWESIDNVPAPELTSRLLESFHEIQDELAASGFTTTGAGRTAPALKRVRGKGFLKYPNEFDIDFSSLGELTTLVAPNEEGKTVLMQLMSAGVNYGETPTRGSLDDLSIAKDSFIEVTQSLNGDTFVLSQMCNGVSRTGSVSLIKNGVPELSKAGRAEYKSWRLKNLIPQNLYDAVICQSGTDSVFDLNDGPRVELLLRVLGLEIYEMLAEAARKRASAASNELAQVRARIEELGNFATNGTLKALRQSLAERLRELERAQLLLVAHEEQLQTAQGKAKQAELARSQYDALLVQKQSLDSRKTTLDSQIADIEERIANNRRILDEKVAIDNAVAGIAENEAKYASLKFEESDLNSKLVTATTELRELQSQSSRLQITLEDRKRSLAGIQATLAEKDAVLLTVEKLPGLEDDFAAWINERDDARRELDEFQASAIIGKDGRIVNLRGALTEIGNEIASQPGLVALDALFQDGTVAKAAEEYPDQLKRLQGAWQGLVDVVRDAERIVASNRADAAKLDRIEAAEQLRSDAEAAIGEVEALIEALPVGIATAQTALSEANVELTRNQSEAQAASRAITGYQPLASKATALSQAETRVEELRIQLDQAQLDRQALVAEILNATPSGDRPELIDISSFETAAALARGEITTCQTRHTLAEREVTDAVEKERRAAELVAQSKTLEASQSIWTRLGIELGKDGLQKAEITAAGPQLTEITNDLLRLAGDTRHSVGIETERESSDKKRMIPCLDIMVFDSVEGISKESRRLSDAGKIIVGWPFSLALIILGCERAGITGPTIFIDEATGPCDVENGPRCAAMLRHFAERLHSQVIFIAQQPEIQALADSRITIRDGVVTVS